MTTNVFFNLVRLSGIITMRSTRGRVGITGNLDYLHVEAFIDKYAAIWGRNTQKFPLVSTKPEFSPTLIRDNSASASFPPLYCHL